MRFEKSLLAAAALALAFTITAGADEVPQEDSLMFDVEDHAEINGQLFVEGMAEKPADLYADVAKVITGPEGSTILYLKPTEARKLGRNGKWEKLPVSAEARPFMAEADWKMFDAEGEPTDDPRFALRVIIPYPVDVNAAMFDVKWNECEGSVTGNYTGLPCNKNRGLSDDYMVFLKKNYLVCVNESLAKVGLPAAVKAHILHDGTMADQRHNRGSLHAVGRAVDVQTITTTTADGKQNTFDFTKTNTNHKLSSSCAPAGTQNCNFYEAFRSCWHKIHVGRSCPRRTGGPIGTIGWEDKAHIAHHLHTSYPFCPNNKGYFITKDSSK